MKRELWKYAFGEKNPPAWPCPICTKGIYVLVPESISSKETIPSQRKHNTPDWNFELFECVFTGWLKCSHCGQEAVVSGFGGVEPDFNDETGKMEMGEYYHPRFCWPMPDIFDIPKRCPETVKNELRAGFALFWADEGAAANHLRIALERLMDHLGVKKRLIHAKGTHRNYTLHERIDLFSKREPSIGGQLMSLKWLGNTGSHEGNLQKDEILDAYEIMENVLNEIIDKRSAKINRLAKELTKKHGKKRITF